jgi:hypothetical protein
LRARQDAQRLTTPRPVAKNDTWPG